MRVMQLLKSRRCKIGIACVAVLAVAALVTVVVVSWLTPSKPLDLSFAEGITPPAPAPAAGTVAFTEETGYHEVGRTDRFRLELSAEETMFRLVDNQSGMIWYGGYHTDENPEDIIPRNRRIMHNLLSVTYIDAEDNISSLNSSADDVETSYTLIEDGFEILFRFLEPSLEITMQVFLDDTGFYARVPSDRIVENGDYRVVSIDVLPAFGSRMSGTDGYLVYPDGSGVLYDCNVSTGSEAMYSSYVYGPPAVSLEHDTADEEGYKSIPLPYYGSAGGGSGFVAYVVGGSEYARISLSPGNSIFGLNRIFSSIEYRHMLTVLNAQDEEMEVYSDDRVQADICVKYLLLSGEEADYSGMANALRSYLQTFGLLPEAGIEAGEALPMALDILAGAQQETLLGTSYQDMTTYDQAAAMLESLSDRGVKNIRTVLLGWQKEGYGAGPLSANAAGSSSALRDLQDAYREKNGQLFLQTDYLNAYDGGRFSTQKDIVYNFFDQAVSDRDNSRFLLNPYRQYQKLLNTDLPRYEKLRAMGLAFDGLSSWLPIDTAKHRALTAADSKSLYAAMTRLAGDRQMEVAVQTGNDYLLRYADYLYDVYDGGSDLFMFSREIPFYQMLVHGLIPYSCATPGNMSSDFARTKLQWVEYGSMPYFLVTDKPAGALKDSEVKDVFSSRFADWEETIAQTYAEFSERLSAVYAQQMTAHEYIAEDLVCVTYSSGHRVYINYADEEQQAAGAVIPAQDYVVINP